MITVYIEVYAFLISCIKREGKVYVGIRKTALAPQGKRKSRVRPTPACSSRLTRSDTYMDKKLRF